VETARQGNDIRRVAAGYSPADDGIVDEAKERIAKLN